MTQICRLVKMIQKSLIFDIYLCSVFSEFFSKMEKREESGFTLEVSKNQENTQYIWDAATTQ